MWINNKLLDKMYLAKIISDDYNISVQRWKINNELQVKSGRRKPNEITWVSQTFSVYPFRQGLEYG